MEVKELKGLGMTLEDIKVGRYYKSKSNKTGTTWEVWFVDKEVVSLMRSRDSRGLRVKIDKFLKNWVKA